MDVLGLVENMSGLTCPHCGQRIELFKAHGGEVTAKKQGLRLLGRLPIEPLVVDQGDKGWVSILDDDRLEFSRAFQSMVDGLVQLQDKKTDVVKDRKEAAKKGKTDREAAKALVIPVSGDRLSSHFGHCDEFAFIRTETVCNPALKFIMSFSNIESSM